MELWCDLLEGYMMMICVCNKVDAYVGNKVGESVDNQVGDFYCNKVGDFVDTFGNLVDSPVCSTVEESCGNKIGDSKYLEWSRVLSLGVWVSKWTRFKTLHTSGT